MPYKTLMMERLDTIGVITLNCPDSLNAMSFTMAEEFKDAINQVQADSGIKVLLLAGQGNSFCSGGDLNSTFDMYNLEPALAKDRILHFYECFLSVKNLTIPTIAVLKGYILGAGLCMALACDMRIASSDSKLGMSFIKLGLSPGMGGTHFLPRLVGTAKALEMCLTGELINPEEALRIGLLNCVMHPEQLSDYAMNLAVRIAGHDLTSLRLIKESIYLNAERNLKSCLIHEALSQVICASGDEMKKAVNDCRDRLNKPMQ